MTYEEILASANTQLANAISWLNGMSINEDLLSKVVGTYAMITIEHLHGMIVLAEKGRDVSLTALMRPQFEALVRGSWLAYEGTDEIAAAIIANEQVDKEYEEYEFKDLDKLCKAIDRKLSEEKMATMEKGKLTRKQFRIASTVTMFESHRKKNIQIYHSLTHGGSEMVLRCLSGEEGEHIQSNFTEDEISNILLAATLNMLMMIRAYAKRIGDTELETKATDQLNDLPVNNS